MGNSCLAFLSLRIFRRYVSTDCFLISFFKKKILFFHAASTQTPHGQAAGPAVVSDDYFCSEGVLQRGVEPGYPGLMCGGALGGVSAAS